MNWFQHVEKWKDCQACSLGQQRDRICLARGSLPATVIFVGEAPGMSEDAIGLPFVGPAGHRLDQIIAAALPADVTYALTNLVACFPREAKSRGENEPERNEILECRPRLIEFVNIAKPRLIVCVGKLASQYITHDSTIPCVDIDHPAYILRMPLAQQQMATQKCIVVLRNAVEDVLQTKPTTYRQWGAGYAKVKQINESDIPY